jgi:hypothetical protein
MLLSCFLVISCFSLDLVSLGCNVCSSILLNDIVKKNPFNLLLLKGETVINAARTKSQP